MRDFLTLARPHLIAALTALLLTASPAFAAKPPKPAPPPACPTLADLEQPFLQWADPARYFLSPSGSFEKGAWSGGTATGGNEPWLVRRGGARDKRSLSVAAPGAATSPDTCIGLSDPTLRLFARQVSGPPLSTLGVSVSFEGVTGGTQTLPLLSIASLGPGQWAVTAPIPILVNATVLPKALGADPVTGAPSTNARFTFAPSPGSAWQIDDVYVDPYRHR